jgi:hypothetical protein
MPHAGMSIDVTPGTKTQVARQVSETRIVLKGLEDSDLRALTQPCTEYCQFCWTVKHHGEEGTVTMPDTFEEQGKYVRSTPVHRTQGSLSQRYGHAQCKGNKPTPTGLRRIAVLPELRKKPGGLRTRFLRPGPRQALEYN